MYLPELEGQLEVMGDRIDAFGIRRRSVRRPRYRAEPSWAFAAKLDGEVVGSNFAARWGSFAFLGPLSVRPDLWNQGVASRLMEPIVDLFERWHVRQAGLFTFPNSPKHLRLYRIWGLDVSHEVRAIQAQRLGDTVLVHDDSGVAGFAACHCGAGEAGSGSCYVKFAAARPGSRAPDHLESLAEGFEALAAARGASRITAGINVARDGALGTLLARGYATQFEGVIMQRPDEPGYCRPDAYVIDDLR